MALLQTLAVDPQSLGLELGTGAVIGGIIGFAAKKLAKVIAIIVGLELALFKFLEARGILQVNWDRLGASFLGTAQEGEAAAASWFDTLLTTLSVSAGFVGGFWIGFRRG